MRVGGIVPTFRFITVLNGTGDLVIDEVLFDNFECR
jgi:hypothetical protein